jgi:hypothetical protein
MATTTNYAWETPDDTDLVKDGAAAIRTLGSSVDTTTKALNPSTTQGDIEYRSATANTNTRLPLGTAGQVLQVNSGATAPEWATPAGGGMTELATGTLSGAITTISSISGDYIHLYLIIVGPQATTSSAINYTLNGNTSSAYFRNRVNYDTATWTASATALTSYQPSPLGIPTSANSDTYSFLIENYSITGYKSLKHQLATSGSGVISFGSFNGSTAAITSIEIKNTGGFSMSVGTYTLYGVK